MAFKTYIFGDPKADTLLLQMADDHDLEGIEREVSYIRELSNGQEFCLKAVKVNSWNRDLSPWPAPAVFGKEDFGAGAKDTLEYLLKEELPGLDVSGKTAGRNIFIGGYSLSGLFALWAGYQTDRFRGIAAASPSIWFPGFVDYMRRNTALPSGEEPENGSSREGQLMAEAVYLSLGDKEERTRNIVMAQVGNAIREGYAILKDSGKDCVLEWNQGNHFKEPDLRTAKAFAWLMNRAESRGRQE